MKTVVYIIGLFLGASIHQSFAQKGFAYKAPLADIDSNGFYKFSLPLEVLAKSNPKLSDIRIRDEKGSDMPFLIEDYLSVKDVNVIEFPFVSKSIHADKKMHVVVKSTDRGMTQLALEIQNTMVSRMVNINGSHDGKEWFVVKEHVPTSDIEKYGSDSYRTILELPRTNYSFFEIVFSDKDLLPVNILKVGSVLVRNGIPATRYDTVYSTSINQIDSSNKTSYLRFSFKEPYPIERLALQVSGPKFYRRNAAVNIGYGFDNNLTISSDTVSWITVDAKQPVYHTQIYNEDNQPLKVVSAIGLVKKQALYVWLEKGSNCALYFGDSLALAPVYDLVYFKNLIQANAPSIPVGVVEKNAQPTPEKPTIKSNKQIIWLAMGAALIALLFMTYKLVGEIKKRNG